MFYVNEGAGKKLLLMFGHTNFVFTMASFKKRRYLKSIRS